LQLTWSDDDAKNEFLTKIVADARRLVAQVDGADASAKEVAISWNNSCFKTYR